MSELAASLVLNGRYRLEELVGEGGFGETWRAADTLLDRTVAIKVFRDVDPERRDRYLREARTMARFQDEPGIVRVEDFFADGDRFCLVMEYLDGQNLSDCVAARGRLGLDETLRLLQPVFGALEHIHEAGMVHRDVSPDNIRLLPNGRVKLLDFGSATDIQAEPGTIYVKPGYAPFEQYAGGELGPWTDVYALSATIYRCITGRVPMDSLQRTVQDSLPRPSELGVSLTPEQEDGLMRGLAVRPEDRVRSVGELWQALKPGSVQETRDQDERTRIDLPHGPAVGVPTEMVPRPEPPLVDMKPGGETGDRWDDQPYGPTDKTGRKGRPWRGTGGHKKPGDSRRSRKGASGRTRVVVLACVAIAVVAVLAIVLGSRTSNTYRSSASSSTSYVEDANVTSDMLDTIGADVNTDTLMLSHCQLDDDDIRQIAQMTNVEILTLNACSGYTTLDPLADMGQLKRLSVMNVDGLDGSTCFSRTFENVSVLSFDTVRFSGQCDFIKNFPNLTSLDIEKQEGATDASFLADLSKLKWLEIEGFDLSGEAASNLSGHPALGTVMVDSSGLSTLEWVRDCPDLHYLSATGNAISDISPLSGCDNLDYLYLSDNQIADITPLSASLGQLITLDLSGNQIADASVLSGLSQIGTLRVSDNQLTDVSFLDGLVTLTKLALSNNQISDISALASCNKLQIGLLNGNQISDISAFENGFDDLAALNLADNQIPSVESLAGCDALESLSVARNQLTSLTGLDGKPALEYLMANGNQITDISALDGDDALKAVDLGSNQVSDASALSSMGKDGEVMTHGIQILLDHNDVSSLEWLPASVRIGLLALNGNPVADLSRFGALEDFPYAVYLPYSEESDYTDLDGLAGSSTSALFLVDVPNSRKNQITEDVGLDGNVLSDRLQFVSGDEADSQLAAVRDELAERVSSFE